MKMAFLVVCTVPALFWQLGTEAVRTRGVLQGDGAIRIGADPEEPRDLVRILADRQIVELLSLEPSVADATKEFVESQKKDWINISRPSLGRVPESVARSFLEEDKLKSELFLDEALGPEKIKRFKQLVYRMEVDAIGWGLSLTEGRLGNKIGVYEDQKEELERKVSAILDDLRSKIDDLNRKAEEEILSQLVPEQSRKARELIGPYSAYKHATVVEAKFDRLRQMRSARQEREEAASESPDR